MAGPFQTWSPSLLGSKATKIPRRLVEVPKDQEELLNKSDSWHKGHVPAAILDKIKAGYTETRRRSPVAEPPLSDHVRASSQSSRRLPAAGVPSSPIPAPPQTKEPQLAAVVELSLPSNSSDSSEDEAEIQGPKAPLRTDAHPGEPQASRILIPPGPTPPSAQVIPSTYPEPSATVSPPKPKRQRLMKNVAASLNPAEVSKQLTRPSILSLPKPASPPPLAGSSLPPSSSVPASPMAIRTQPASPLVIRAQPAMQPAAVPSMMLRGGGLPRSSGSSDKPPPNVPASQDPYNVFKETYPDYDGSLGDFVRGVLSLIPLQKKKTVPQYILDDYIRVFSGDYLEYIEQLREDQTPLTTWEWYCVHVPQPVYMKGVLSSDRLKDFRRRYPDKVSVIEAQTTPLQSSIQPPEVQHIQRSNAFSTPAPARIGQHHNAQHNQASSPIYLPDSPPMPLNPATRSSTHIAELATDPISTAEDRPFEIHPRGSRRRSTEAVGPASRFISASSRQFHTQSTRPVNMTASRLSSSSVRFETQVNFPSLETTASGNSIWDREDDAMGSVDRQEDNEALNDGAPSPSLQGSGEDALQQAAAGIPKSHIEYRVSGEGIKRPWETIDDPKQQEAVQQQCFAAFLRDAWGLRRNKGKQVGAVV
ncbi:uncharacterized protein QC761_102710 [Podospora bellae-mahoneyi]|uniref:Uncharacterized protein n=1 Tax=Podospora bellae-mahoneyi TaxID=2093777 RepID=A0ABR0FW76_9PEZI|nr:hypothetical protein QC761_102710 [Podospora bellae-mahoneyi]